MDLLTPPLQGGVMRWVGVLAHMSGSINQMGATVHPAHNVVTFVAAWFLEWPCPYHLVGRVPRNPASR